MIHFIPLLLTKWRFRKEISCDAAFSVCEKTKSCTLCCLADSKNTIAISKMSDVLISVIRIRFYPMTINYASVASRGSAQKVTVRRRKLAQLFAVIVKLPFP